MPAHVDESQLSATLSALADPTRRAILVRLASGEATVGELAEPFAMSQPAISKHLRVLSQAGLITQRVTLSDGRAASSPPRCVTSRSGPSSSDATGMRASAGSTASLPTLSSNVQPPSDWP